ncbi:MAG: transglutaminase-like domain-containing protein [bacterium]
MAPDTQALIRLLRDSDEETVRLVKQQLISMAEDNPHCLDELATSDDERISQHAREILAGIADHDAVQDFDLLCHLGGENFPTEQAAWMLARAVQPELPTARYEEQVDDWGREFLSRIPLAANGSERVRLLTEFLSDELGFRGNSSCYYCEENSLLPHVVETRLGIPISLALVYMMVGSRAGLRIEGINLPGHFIARHGGVYFDPFHGGRILSQHDVKQLLARQNIEFKESHLLPATSRQFLLRMLANLLYVYDLDEEHEKRERVKSWMDAISYCATVG